MNDSYMDETTPAPHLFYFDSDTREDGWSEQSINWRDDDSAITLCLRQKKPDGELQFKTGVALIPRCEIDRLKMLPVVNGLLSYERRELDGNPYHGNLLLRGDVPKPKMKMIAAGLALAVSDVVPHDPE